MGERFDPYHRWLAISPEEQPADHYRLLGCKRFEDDPDVIESAADRQMAHVRSFQSGEYADDAQRILNEISAARLVLLKPEEKKAYDKTLKSQQETKTKKIREPKIAQALPLEQPAPPVTASAPPTPLPVTAASQPSAAAGPAITTRVKKRKGGLSGSLLSGAVVLLMLVAIAGMAAIAFVVRPWELDEVAHNDGNRPPPPDVQPPPTEPTDSSSPPAEAGADGETDDGSLDANEPSPDQAIDGQEDAATPPDEPEEFDLPDETHPDEFEPEPTPRKHSVPDSGQRQAARRKIEGIFSLQNADTLEKRIALVNELMQIAGETKDDPATQFALLNWAREIAAEVAQVRLAMQAVDRLEAAFDFDGTTVRRATLGEAINSPVPPTEKKELLAVGIEMMDEMMIADEYETAGKLAIALLDVARRARDGRLLDEVVARRTRAEELVKQFRNVQAALKTLESDPANADAHLAAGRFYLFAKNDWGRALPMLAQGSDALLAQAAQAEIDTPSTTADEEALAKAWWDAAEAESETPAKAVLYARSMAWYQRVAPKLKGLQQAAAEQRIKKLAAAGVRPLDSIVILDGSGLVPGSALPHRTWIDVLKWTNVLSGGPTPWAREGDEVISGEGGKGKSLRLPVDVAGSYQLHVDATVETPGGIVFVIPVGARRVNLTMGEADWTLQWVNGKNRTQSIPKKKFSVGQRVAVTITVQVSEDGSTAEISYAMGGATVGSWQGNPGSLRGWPGKSACPPTLAGWDARIRFHTAKVRLLSGKAVLHEDAELYGEAAANRATTDTSDGLVAHWTFDEGQGDLARDAAGENDGKISGATWTKGIRGGALSFDGQDDLVLIGNPDKLNFEGPISLAAWIRINSLPQRGNFSGILKHGYTLNPPRGVFLRIDNDKSLIFTAGTFLPLGNNHGYNHSAKGSAAESDKDQWMHLAGTFDGAHWRLYRDGKLLDEQASTIGAVKVADGWAIGGHPSRNQRYFKGDIDDVRIYNRALSAEEVADLVSDSQAAAVPTDAELVDFLTSRHWLRYIHKDGKRDPGTPFTFHADGSCVGKKRNFVSGVKAWEIDDGTLILNDTSRMKYADGEFRGPNDGAMWVFRPR